MIKYVLQNLAALGFGAGGGNHHAGGAHEVWDRALRPVQHRVALYVQGRSGLLSRPGSKRSISRSEPFSSVGADTEEASVIEHLKQLPGREIRVTESGYARPVGCR